MTTPMKTTDIEIEIHSESVNSEFLIVPNALLRGEGQWASLRLAERAMLGALLTLPPSGWRTSRTRVEAMALGHGRDAVTKILNGLRDHRHLYTHRIKVSGGKFRWMWRVYMFPQPEGFDPFDVVSENQPHHVSAGRAIDWKPGHGEGVDGSDLREQGVSAGRSIDWFPVTENTSLKEKDLGLKDLRKTPPTPRASAADHAPVRAATEGEENSEGTKPQNQERSEGVDEILSVRSDWSRDVVDTVLGEVVTRGVSWGVAVVALRDLAVGRYGHTVSPRRLLANGPWFAAGATFVPTPSLSPDDVCSAHRGQLRASCACCRGERLGAASVDGGGRPSERTTMPESALGLLPAGLRSRRVGGGGAG